MRHTIRDFLTQEHSTTTGFRALANHDFNRIRFAQIIGVHAVTRWKILIDQLVRMPALFGRHATIARCRGGARHRRAAPQRFFRGTRQRTKGHACDGHRDIKLDRIGGVQATNRNGCFALLAVAFQRISRNRSAHEE